MSTKPLPMGTALANVGQAMNLQPAFAPRTNDVDRLKRGDYVRIMIQFRPETPSEANPKPRNFEMLTALVMERRSPIIAVKIQTTPSHTPQHGLEFGDVIHIQEQHVIWHEPATPEQVKQVEHLLTGVIPEAQPVNEADRKLREAGRNLPPLAPVAGKVYWLRNGLDAKVWGQNPDGSFIGNLAGEAVPLRWLANGRHENNLDLDIVKDPTANEVIA